MIYGKYTVIKRMFCGGKLYHPGEVVDHQDGFENRKSLKGIGDPLTATVEEQVEETKQEKEESVNDDVVKRWGAGKWKLPNGYIFTGKLAEAKEYWEKNK